MKKNIKNQYALKSFLDNYEDGEVANPSDCFQTGKSEQNLCKTETDQCAPAASEQYWFSNSSHYGSQT